MTRIESFILIIGAMKAGTTSLFQYLASHPQIASGRKKEPNFFSHTRNWEQGADYYFEYWRNQFDSDQHRYAIEGSTAYTMLPRYRRTASRIRAFDAQFRFIYIVRDPIERIESHLAHNIARGRLRAECYREGLIDAVRTSRYSHQLDAFRRPLGNPEVLLLDFTELRRDPLTLLRRCEQFLELDPFPFEPRPPANIRRTANGSETFHLTTDDRRALRMELQGYVERLRDGYGFDVSTWDFPDLKATV